MGIIRLCIEVDEKCIAKCMLRGDNFTQAQASVLIAELLDVIETLRNQRAKSKEGIMK